MGQYGYDPAEDYEFYDTGGYPTSGGGGGGSMYDIYNLPTSGPTGFGMYPGYDPSQNGYPNSGYDPTQDGYGAGFSVTHSDPSSQNGGTYYPSFPQSGGGGNPSGGNPGNPSGRPLDPTNTVAAFTPPGNTTNNTTNNTTKNSTSNSYSNSVGLPSNTYSTGVPSPGQFKYTPISIARGNTPIAPPIVTPEKSVPTTGTPMPGEGGKKNNGGPLSSITFDRSGAGVAKDSAPVGSTGKLGTLARTAAGLFGVDLSNPVPPAYRGIYEALHPKKSLTEEEKAKLGQAAAYRDTYGLGG